MKKVFIILVLAFAIMTTGICFATVTTEVYVESTPISGNTWLLDYTVSNISLGTLEELTVEFDFDSFDNLIDVSGPEAACDIEVWPAISQTYDGWAFDVLFDTPLANGDSFTAISMQVDYLGIGNPIMQYYEVIDPVTFATIVDGYTVPEPTTLLLFGFSALLLRRRFLKLIANG